MNRKFSFANLAKRLRPALAVTLLLLTIWSGYRLMVGAGSMPELIATLAGSTVILLLVAIRVAHWRFAGALGAVVGLACIAAGVLLTRYESEHVTKYNEAMVALNKHDLPALVKSLEEASNAYKAENTRGYLWRLVFGEPRKEVEARVHFHRGVALVQAKKGKEAVEQFWLSLRLNPGNRYIGLTSEEAALWYNDALQAKYNLEKLYQSGQGGGNGQAKGKNPAKGQGKQPAPGEGKDPSNGAGKRSRDTL